MKIYNIGNKKHDKVDLIHFLPETAVKQFLKAQIWYL